MFCLLKKRKQNPADLSKDDSNWGKQFILMIPNGEECHYLAVKQLSALSRWIASKHHGDFYYMN